MNATTTPADTQSPISDWPERVSPKRYGPVPIGEFLRADVPRRKWAVDGIWAEKRSGIIAGKPKAGKTTIATELAITLATGAPFLGQEAFRCLAHPAPVTYIQAENSTARVRRDFDRILEARGLGFTEPVMDLLDPDGDAVGDRFQPLWEGTGWEPDLAILSHPGMDLMVGEDREWLLNHAKGRDYVFLDPAYLLASANPNDMRDVMSLLTFLSEVRDKCDCGVVLTHQMTDKHGGGDAASRLLGSTFFHGWYEGAILVDHLKDDTFKLDVDNLREMSEQRSLVVQGLGVGSWFYVPSAQDKQDARGRRATQSSAKETRKARFRELHAEHGESWPNDRYAQELGVGTTTIKTYKAEIRRDGKV